MRARPEAQRDAGVSPVVGMILVLGISITGIAAILYWGLPAIDEMKATVEHRSLQTQFQELNAAIQELIAGTTEKTAKRWEPAISRGEIAVQSGTEPWLYEIEPSDPAGLAHNDFIWTGLADGDNTFTVYSNNTTANVKVEAFVVHGTTTLDTLIVSCSSSDAGTVGCTSGTQMTGTNLPVWTAGSSKTFKVYLSDGTTTEPLTSQTFKFRIWSGSTITAEAWYMQTGRVDYNLSAGLAPRGVVENNGAVLTGDSRGVVLMQQPPIPPPSTANGVERFFGRAVVMTGGASFGGENRFDLLVSLYSSATLASYDCSLYATTKADCVEGIKIFDYGQYQTPWYAYLTNTAQGYRMVKYNAQGVTMIKEREPYMAATILESTINLS